MVRYRTFSRIISSNESDREVLTVWDYCSSLPRPSANLKMSIAVTRDHSHRPGDSPHLATVWGSHGGRTPASRHNPEISEWTTAVSSALVFHPAELRHEGHSHHKGRAQLPSCCRHLCSLFPLPFLTNSLQLEFNLDQNCPVEIECNSVSHIWNFKFLVATI